MYNKLVLMIIVHGPWMANSVADFVWVYFIRSSLLNSHTTQRQCMHDEEEKEGVYQKRRCNLI